MPKTLQAIISTLGILVLAAAEVCAGPGEVIVSGDAHQISIVEGLATIPYDVSQVSFDLNPNSIRSRFMLEGLDKTWVPQAEDMNFGIRFFDRKGDQITQKWFSITGESLGWKGDWRTSAFLSRSRSVKIPENAESFSLVISSSGPASSVGVYAVSGISVKSVGSAVNVAYLIDSRKPDSSPSIWAKSGTHPSMGMVLTEPGESPHFVITDDDLEAHADLESEFLHLKPSDTGESLEISWKEAFSIGHGGPYVKSYERIPAGSYRLIMENLTMTGIPTGEVKIVRLLVTRPFWETVWFWSINVGLLTFLIYICGRHLIRKKFNRNLRHAQLIANERLRIARDLHDDLGTRLSHIYLLGAHSETISNDQEARASFQQISEMSGELITALSETVWMLNSNNDDLESLVNFLCKLVAELCKLSDIRCRIDAMSVEDTMPISQEFRHNISLAVKETIHNVLKHSGADEIRMKISMDERVLKILITDNGTGMGDAPNKTGSGLESVGQRLKTLRGRYLVAEHPEGGLEVRIEAPVR